MGIIAMLLIGIVAGWLAGRIMKGGGFGMIGNMVVGVLGAVIAGFILPQVGIAIEGGLITSILSATFGAVVLLFVVGLVEKAWDVRVSRVKLSVSY